jgi:tol-pal system protein YbgF
VDYSTLRRDQRMLYRRLADTRADLDRLNREVSRLRAQYDELRYGRGGSRPPTGFEPEPPPAEPLPPSTTDAPPAEPHTQPGETSYRTAPTFGNWPGESGASGQEPVAPPPAPSGVDVQADMALGGDPEYRDGLERYASRDYQRSAQSLRGFVAKNPRDALVPVAQYWLGEAYFAQGKYNEAILAYNEILVSHPKSDHVPAALLRQGDAFAETGDKIDARMIFQKLIDDHPNSVEAGRAKEQLRALGG